MLLQLHRENLKTRIVVVFVIIIAVVAVVTKTALFTIIFT
jgi:hypothetical protein